MLSAPNNFVPISLPISNLKFKYFIKAIVEKAHIFLTICKEFVVQKYIFGALPSRLGLRFIDGGIAL
jgi:hypothetical protein